MDIRELRSFCAAARLGSITKGADELGIGQPAVSKHISMLEQELDGVLFDRVRRPIRLTVLGQRLMERAMPLVQSLDSLLEDTRTDEKKSPLSIVTNPSIARRFLADAIKEYSIVHAGQQVRVNVGNHTQVMSMLKAGEVDLAIQFLTRQEPWFDFVPLFQYSKVVVASRNHPILRVANISFEDLAHWPLILHSSGSYIRGCLEREFQRRHLTYTIAFDVGTTDLVRTYVALGLGISVLPRIALNELDLISIGTVDIDMLMPAEEAGIFFLRGRTLSTPARDFIALVNRLVQAGSDKSEAAAS